MTSGVLVILMMLLDFLNITMSRELLVGIKSKGVGCVDQFLMNKFLAYTQMTLSKYVSILEAMLLHLATSFLPTDKSYSGNDLKGMVTASTPNENYLAFTDSYVIHKIYEFSGHGSMFPSLLSKIISRLKNYSAFDLAHESESEVLCIGFSDEEVREEISKSEVYKRFNGICDDIESYSGSKLRESGKACELFAYRFEQYNLTKQVPICEFQTMFDFKEMLNERRFNCHYYRLANGIPVLDKKQYQYKEEDCIVDPISIPQLVVDCAQASLHKLSSMRFVALREYKVEEYSLTS